MSRLILNARGLQESLPANTDGYSNDRGFFICRDRTNMPLHAISHFLFLVIPYDIIIR
jgi:hypothetical protein